MGWYKIDPETGLADEKGASKLSEAPDLLLLNAIPHVDNEEGAHYLGDGPADMASTLPSEIAEAADAASWSPEEIRQLIGQGRVPKGVSAEAALQLAEIVRAFWQDIDGCYEEDWDRGVLPGERKWICEHAVSLILNRDEED